MLYPTAAMERAMKVQEVILRALSGALSWLQAADILGIHPRSLRRWRGRYEADGILGLYDRRHRRPSRLKAPVAEVQRILRLYREHYLGFNVRHFHHLARRDHGLQLSYSFVKLALQDAGLVRKGRARGRRRRRREPRPCFGELLHLDGSPHAWLAVVPEARPTLLQVLDDATKRLLYAQLVESESTATVMTARREVVQTSGLPMALYTDRAGWAFHTPKAGGPVTKAQLTQVGRALARLGIVCGTVRSVSAAMMLRADPFPRPLSPSGGLPAPSRTAGRTSHARIGLRSDDLEGDPISLSPEIGLAAPRVSLWDHPSTADRLLVKHERTFHLSTTGAR